MEGHLRSENGHLLYDHAQLVIEKLLVEGNSRNHKETSLGKVLSSPVISTSDVWKTIKLSSP